MKKYIIYGFFLSWSFISFIYYKSYSLAKEQKMLILDTHIAQDYEMAREFVNSKLKNIYFQCFNTPKLKNIIDNKQDPKQDLNSIIYTIYLKYKSFLKNITLYNLDGRKIMTMDDKDVDYINKDILDSLSKNDRVVFEYFNKSSKGFIKIIPINYNGKKVGYLKLSLSLDTFMNNFLPKYKYSLLKSNKKSVLDIYLISLQAINSEFYFALRMDKKEYLKENIKQDMYLKILISGFLLGIFFFLLYRNIKKENILKAKIKWQKEFFRKVIDTSPNPIFVKDKNKKYLLANSATANLFGFYSSDNMIEKTNEELEIHEKIVISLNKDEEHALHTKELTYKQIQKIGDQYYKFVHVPMYNLEYPINEEMVLGFATNITLEIQRKNELAKLNTQLKLDIFDEMTNRIKINEKFKKIFDNIHDAMFICKIDPSGRLSSFIDINSSGKIFLNQFTQFKGKDPNDIFDGIKLKYNKELNRFETKKYSYLLKIPNGRNNINFKVSCSIILINHDFHAVIFVQLIDEIMKLKKEKKEKQVLISNIFEKAKSGIAVINKDGDMVKYNRSFYQVLDLDSDYFKNNSFFSIFLDKEQEQIRKEHNDLFDLEKDLSCEYRFFVNNKTIDTIASSTLIDNSNGDKLRLFIFEDITKQKLLEKEQSQNSKIIAQQAKMAEMGEMIGAIAHQWRQPLNAINAAAIKLNFATTLDMLDENEVLEKTKFIEKQSLKMSETINDFMNFFKPSRSKESFTLSLIYKKIFDFLEPQLKNREIDMSLDITNDITIYGFQNEFEHILLNLINNARDAFDNKDMELSKKIVVSAYEKENKNIVKVSDNAGGIPSHILNKVFNPYFTTKEEGKGTGIGLYMTKTIIDKHFNGSIEVQNSEDGAVFTIIFSKGSK